MKNSMLRYGEKVIKDGVASQIEIEGVAAKSGNLILTDSRLLLVPHKMKRNSTCVEIPLNRISKLDDKFNVFCNTPNLVDIITIDGRRFQFAVKKGQKTAWEQSINQAAITYSELHPPAEQVPVSEAQPETEEIKQEQSEQSTDHPQDKSQAEEVPGNQAVPQYTITIPAPPHVNNILIWLVVFAPIVALFFQFGFWLFLLIAMGFCYWDESNLRRQGYDTFQLGYACIIPAYLYKRAKLCNSSMSSLIVWCFLFVIGAFCTFVSLDALIQFLQTFKDIPMQ